MGQGPGREGLASTTRGQRVLDLLLIPRDPRGIVLLCGFVAAAIFGLMAILNPPGDLMGWAFVVVAVSGYFFIQTRLVPSFLWLLVAAGGVAVAWAGNPSGWLETFLGLALAGVSMFPLPPEYRGLPRRVGPTVVSTNPPAQPIGMNGSSEESAAGETSRKLEVSPIQASAKVELSDAPSVSANGATPQPTPARIAINAIGHLRIEVDGKDITQRLSEPRLEFLFTYLLARQIRGVEVVAERSAVADEVAPGISPASKRDRLRKQLYDLQTAHPVFDGMLRTNRSLISLDLSGVEFDVGRLLESRKKIRQRDSLVGAELAEQIRSQLQASTGEILAGFNELEHQVTGGKGNAAQVVLEARAQVAAARAELALALAKYDSALSHPDLSIPYLKDALDESQQRQDLARALVAAYLQAGQPVPASRLRREYGLEEN